MHQYPLVGLGDPMKISEENFNIGVIFCSPVGGGRNLVVYCLLRCFGHVSSVNMKRQPKVNRFRFIYFSA